MNVNATGAAQQTYTDYNNINAAAATKAPETTPADSAAQTAQTPAPQSSVGAVYDKGSSTSVNSTKQLYKPNQALIDQLKSDAKAQQDQLMSYVQQMMTGQGNALAESNDIWRYLASGNFTVDELAKKKAEEAISEDGYWGVNKTSDRILEFAKALTGGDPSKIEDMRSAFQKGFGEATKTWGKDLPEISSQTYDAVMKKFDQWANEANSGANSGQSSTAPTVDATTAAVSGTGASSQA